MARRTDPEILTRRPGIRPHAKVRNAFRIGHPVRVRKASAEPAPAMHARPTGGFFPRVTYLTALPFVSHEINKHAVLQIHTEASKP